MIRFGRVDVLFVSATPLICLLVAGAKIATGVAQKDEERMKTKQVLAAGIPRRTQIIGTLGRPLGELIAVRGQWVRPSSPATGALKDASLRVRITHVDGARLKRPVEFHRGLVIGLASARIEPGDDEQVELRGYETGGMRGIPLDAREELGPRAVQEPTYIRGFSFVTQFTYLSHKPISP